MEIRYELEDGRLAVEVTDEGGGFDPELLMADAGDLDEGGLGIAIIRAVTDELAVARRPGGEGSCLRFTKYFD